MAKQSPFIRRYRRRGNSRGRKGVLTGILSVPCRYIHSPNGVIDLKDFEHTLSLVIELVRRAREIKGYES